MAFGIGWIMKTVNWVTGGFLLIIWFANLVKMGQLWGK